MSKRTHSNAVITLKETCSICVNFKKKNSAFGECAIGEPKYRDFDGMEYTTGLVHKFTSCRNIQLIKGIV